MCLPLLIAFSSLSDINTTLKIGITATRSFTLRYVINYDVGKRYHITMSLQSQYVVGLNRDQNPTKNRCRHNIKCLLGFNFLPCAFKIIIIKVIAYIRYEG